MLIFTLLHPAILVELSKFCADTCWLYDNCRHVHNEMVYPNKYLLYRRITQKCYWFVSFRHQFQSIFYWFYKSWAKPSSFYIHFLWFHMWKTPYLWFFSILLGLQRIIHYILTDIPSTGRSEMINNGWVFQEKRDYESYLNG